MMSHLDWSDIRIFLAVVRSGSTLAAARHLNIGQATVSRRIGALEHALGVVLFDRDTRGFHANATAMSLIDLAEQMEATATELSRTALKTPAPQAGLIRITATAAVLTENFAEILSEFGDIHPDVKFDLVSSHRPLDLMAGEADVAIRYARKITDPDLICRHLSHVKARLYASPRYRDRHGIPRSENDLAEHKFVLLSLENARLSITHWLKDRIKPDQIAMQHDDLGAVITSIQSGFGIGILARGIGDAQENLVPCFDAPPEVSMDTWLLASPEAYKRPEVKAFMAFFAPRYARLMKRQKEGAQ